MNIKLILSKCFILLYRENELKNISVSNKEFVLNTIKDLEIVDTSLTLTHESKKILGIRDLIVEMTRVPKNEKFDPVQKLNDLRIICEDDTSFYDAVRESLYKELSERELASLVISLRHEITNILKEDEIKKVIFKASNTLKYKSYEIADIRKYLQGFISELEPYQKGIEEKEDPAVVASVNFSTGEGLADVFKEIRSDAKGETILKFPWQCLNRMTQGGLRRGQLTSVAALQHHNKSGFCLSACLGFCYYNDGLALLKDKEKIPTIVYISLENEASKVVGDIYVTLKENIDNIKIDKDLLSKIQPNVTAEYVKEKVSRNGYNFVFRRVNPNDWTYMDLFGFIISLEAQGCEIHLCCVDYLNQLPKTGCSGSGDPDKVQDLFNRVRNFFSAKNIAFLTPHQLSTEALELHRQGKTDLALIVSDGNYYHASKGIGREMDLELFLYLVKDSGRTYQCIARGKHRITGITNPEYLYYILPFEEVGGLRWDIESDDTSLKKIGQKRNTNGEIEDPFWM